MINKRLIRLCGNSKKYIALTIGAKWVSLLCNIAILWTVGSFVDALIAGTTLQIALYVAVLSVCASVRFIGDMYGARFSHMASAQAKKTLRSRVYQNWTIILVNTFPSCSMRYWRRYRFL